MATKPAFEASHRATLHLDTFLDDQGAWCARLVEAEHPGELAHVFPPKSLLRAGPWVRTKQPDGSTTFLLDVLGVGATEQAAITDALTIVRTAFRAASPKAS